MSDYTPGANEVRADFITLHTRNFDAYTVGRSLTSEQEVYGDVFDRMIAEVERASADKALTDAANAIDSESDIWIIDDRSPRGGAYWKTQPWLRARAEAYRQEKAVRADV